jgi:hypothetical protein
VFAERLLYEAEIGAVRVVLNPQLAPSALELRVQAVLGVNVRTQRRHGGGHMDLFVHAVDKS